MSLKKLLGLEAFPIKESDIMRKIQEARKKHLHEIEFTSNKHKVICRIRDVAPEGITRWY
jgi:hypothetical protein